MPRALANIASAAREVAERSVLFNNDPSPFFAAVADGSRQMVVVTGENASGKSLFARVVSSILRVENRMVPVSVSIRERTGAGLDEMSSFRKVMMFGEEHERSTGATSASVVQTAFGNLRHDGGSVLVLDEPEIGLADSYTRALGQFIGEQATRVPRVCGGVMVVTHSRSLVRGIVDGLGADPTHVAISAGQPARAGLHAWLEREEHRTVDELLALQDVGLERWRRVSRLLGD